MLLVIGIAIFLGFALNIMRFMNFITGAAYGRNKVTRISEMDAHLSFDERIAERMRELENEKSAAGQAAPATPFAPPANPAPQGFGRRGA
jgi:hypothetical protein